MNQCKPGTYPYKIKAGDTLWLIARRYRTTIQAILAVNQSIEANNLQIGQILCIPLGSELPQILAQCASRISREELSLSNHLRMLWSQHVYWTRMVILSIVFNLPDAEVVTNRLMRNPKDLAAALRPYYGDVTAAKIDELFTEHLAIAGELVTAANAGNSAAAADAERRWYANATQIALFLNSINPYWSAQEWQKMLFSHLAMTKNEAVEYISHNYANTVPIFDNIEREALEMADMMTQGIVRQFPQYF